LNIVYVVLGISPAGREIFHMWNISQPLKMNLTEGSETSAKHNLTPGNTQNNIYNIQNTAKV
jgi:hypothetical protein